MSLVQEAERLLQHPNAPWNPDTGGRGATRAAPPERHYPAHPPNLERHNQPVIVFLTVCVHEHKPICASVEFHDLLVKAWRASSQWCVGKYMIMPDHVHLFCSPAVGDAENVRDWAAYWKGLVARALLGRGPLASSVTGAGGTAPSRNRADETSVTGAGGTAPSRNRADETSVTGAGGTAPSRNRADETSV
ncbi:MAG: hypothetical protein WCN95_11445, partial [bacterium]